MRSILTLCPAAILGLFALVPALAQAKCLDQTTINTVTQQFEFYGGSRPADMKALDLCQSETLTHRTLTALSF